MTLLFRPQELQGGVASRNYSTPTRPWYSSDKLMAGSCKERKGGAPLIRRDTSGTKGWATPSGTIHAKRRVSLRVDIDKGCNKEKKQAYNREV